MVRYWFHAYTPETFTIAQRTENREAYFNKEKQNMPEIGDILVCYIAEPRKYQSKYRRFWGLLDIKTAPRKYEGKFWVSTESKTVLKDPSLGIRFDDPKIWPLIKQSLKIKNSLAWGAFVQREPSELQDRRLCKIIEVELKTLQKQSH